MKKYFIMLLCIVYTSSSYYVMQDIDVYEPGIRGAVKADEDFICIGVTDTCFWYCTWVDQGPDADITTFSEVNSVYFPGAQKGMMYVDIISKIEDPVTNNTSVLLRTYDSTFTVFAPTFQDYINLINLFP